MAKIALGPFASSISGRIGKLLVRQTRFGTVVQQQHPPREEVTPREQQVRDRFAVAVRTWLLLDYVGADCLAPLQRAAGTGSPGPWLTAILRYLETGEYRYPYATLPQIAPIIERIWFDGVWWKCTLNHAAVPPCTLLYALKFNATTVDDDVPCRTYVSWASRTITLSAPGMVPGNHLLLIPFTSMAPWQCGLATCAPIPYP